MRYVNEAIDYPKFKFEGLTDLKDIVMKGDLMIAFELKSGFSHVEFRTYAKPYVAVQWKGKYHELNSLLFGLKVQPFALLNLCVSWPDNGVG